MDSQHGGDGSRSCAGGAEAAVAETAQQAVISALGTNSAITKKATRGTEQTKVVKGLNHWEGASYAGGVDRRRNRHEGVVDMNEIGTLGVEERGEFPARLRGPNHVGGDGDAVHEIMLAE